MMRVNLRLFRNIAPLTSRNPSRRCVSTLSFPFGPTVRTGHFRPTGLSQGYRYISTTIRCQKNARSFPPLLMASPPFRTPVYVGACALPLARGFLFQTARTLEDRVPRARIRRLLYIMYFIGGVVAWPYVIELTEFIEVVQRWLLVPVESWEDLFAGVESIRERSYAKAEGHLLSALSTLERLSTEEIGDHRNILISMVEILLGTALEGQEQAEHASKAYKRALQLICPADSTNMSYLEQQMALGLAIHISEIANSLENENEKLYWARRAIHFLNVFGVMEVDENDTDIESEEVLPFVDRIVADKLASLNGSASSLSSDHIMLGEKTDLMPIVHRRLSSMPWLPKWATNPNPQTPLQFLAEATQYSKRAVQLYAYCLSIPLSPTSTKLGNENVFVANLLALMAFKIIIGDFQNTDIPLAWRKSSVEWIKAAVRIFPVDPDERDVDIERLTSWRGAELAILTRALKSISNPIIVVLVASMLLASSHYSDRFLDNTTVEPDVAAKAILLAERVDPSALAKSIKYWKSLASSKEGLVATQTGQD